jgi:hypothetical protein
MVLPATAEQDAVCMELDTTKVVWYLQVSEGHCCLAILLIAEAKGKRQQPPLLQL